MALATFKSCRHSDVAPSGCTGRGTSVRASTSFENISEFVVCGAIAQVDFKDSSGSSDLSAVQVDQASSYMAENTSFTGFEGEVRFVRNISVAAVVDPLDRV